MQDQERIAGLLQAFFGQIARLVRSATSIAQDLELNFLARRLLPRLFLCLSIGLLIVPAAPSKGSQGSEGANRLGVPCHLSAADQDWVDRALQARRSMGRLIGRANFSSTGSLILFDGNCAITGTGVLSDGPATWTSTLHSGTIVLPGGRAQAADVVAFAGGSDGDPFFVMSTPSMWRARGVPGGPMGLENLMTAVFLHESAHVSQYATYMRQVAQIAEREDLPEEFGDDSIQERFQDNAEFSASVAQETALLFSAATAPTHAEALRLAQEARALMKVRRERWFTGADAYLGAVEDLFLTLEGSGQWVAYRWLTDSTGGAMTADAAIRDFGQRSGWWSQDAGLALFLAIDRLGGAGWRTCAFGSGALAGAALLDLALQPPREVPAQAFADLC